MCRPANVPTPVAPPHTDRHMSWIYDPVNRSTKELGHDLEKKRKSCAIVGRLIPNESSGRQVTMTVDEVRCMMIKVYFPSRRAQYTPYIVAIDYFKTHSHCSLLISSEPFKVSPCFFLFFFFCERSYISIDLRFTLYIMLQTLSISYTGKCDFWLDIYAKQIHFTGNWRISNF